MDEVLPFVSQSAQQAVYGVPDRVSKGARLSSLEEYRRLWQESVSAPDTFFNRVAKEHLTWFKDFSKVKSGYIVIIIVL
jgi:acetyl-CoA synthetase